MKTRIGMIGIPVLLVCLITLSQGSGARRIEEPGLDADARFTLNPNITSLPFAPRTFANCGNPCAPCGSLTPSSNTAWVADGSSLTNDGTLFFVDVPSYGDGVFQVDPMTCSIVAGSYQTVSYYGFSERGIAYDPEYHDIYHGGWNEGVILQHDANYPYTFLGVTFAGLSIASMAVDNANQFLFVGANSYPDYLYVYDISGGTLGSLLGAWAVPWQAPSGGWVMAGMEFDQDAGQLVMINQYGNYSGTDRELFNFSLGTGPVGAGWCDLANTSFGWGLGLVGDGDPAPTSFYSFVTDIGDFAAPVDLDEYGIPGWFCPPYDLTCRVTTENDVQLTWMAPSEYMEIRVYRNFERIATLPGDAEAYLDIEPGVGHHVYRVCGVTCDWFELCVECALDIYPPPGVCFDFNDTGGGWIAGGTADGYEWGYPSYVFDGNAWETNVGGIYQNNACTWVDSPPINFGEEGGWVTFDSYDYTECNWDGWTLQISLDGGASFSCVYPIEGYDQGYPVGAFNCPEQLLCDSNCGYSVARSWNFDLTDLLDVSAIFRFVFATDSSVAYQGHVFDNFCIFGASVPSVLVQCQLLNPDMDGDGIRDVHAGDYLYYSATFTNLSQDPVDYGAAHFYYGEDSCHEPGVPPHNATFVNPPTTLLEDFNDNSIDSILWRVELFGSGPQLAEANQQLEIEIPGTASGANFGARLVSEFVLSGDFDVQVDYRLIDWPFSNGVRTALAIVGEYGVERTSFGSSSDYPGYPREVYLTDFLDGVHGITATEDIVGKLRLVRTGASQTGYYYGSGGWVLIHTGPAPTGDVAIKLHAWSHDYAFMNWDILAAFDNLRISGEIIPSGNPADRGAQRFFSANESDRDPENPVFEFGPECKGALPGGGVRTHYYRVLVPNNNNLLKWNPFSVEVAAWECEGGTPVMETDRCCFDVTLLPAWEPPPVPEPFDAFVVEEIDSGRLP